MQSTEMELFNKVFDALGYQWSDSNRDKAFLGWELARKAQQPVATQAGAESYPPEKCKLCDEGMAMLTFKRRCNTCGCGFDVVHLVGHVMLAAAPTPTGSTARGAGCA